MIDLNQLEWYDNSFLERTDSCHRKAFYYKLYQPPGQDTPGIDRGVGPGAHFGTCWHAAMAKFYGLQPLGLPRAKRRILAMRAFAATHERLFPDPALLEDKHKLDNGLALLDEYYDYYQQEDEFLEPVDSEVAALIPIQPRPGEPPFDPFAYAIKTDGLIRRLKYTDLYVREFKTTSYGVDRELKKREMDRQTEGYLWGWRELMPNDAIEGVMVDVAHISSSSMEPGKRFKREYFAKSRSVTEEWRQETITKVEAWRSVIRQALRFEGLARIRAFDRSTVECTNYGLCSYYDLCYHGINAVDMRNYSPNTWNPLASTEE